MRPQSICFEQNFGVWLERDFYFERVRLFVSFMTTKINLAKRLTGLSRRAKQLIMLLSDAIAIATFSFFSSWLLFSGVLSKSDYWFVSGLAVSVTLGFGLVLGIYVAIIRYVELDFFHRAILTSGLSALLTPTIAISLQIDIEILKWGILYWALTLVYFCYSRYIPSTYLSRKFSVAEPARAADRILVYGAGSAGSQLVDCLLSGGGGKPIAIVDDDRRLRGTVFKGIKVFAARDIAKIIETKRISRVLLAIPSASRRRRSEIIQVLEPYPVHVQTVPDFQDLVSGKASVDSLRDIDLADLMGRTPVPPDPKLMGACITGKVVMVTGAGGSVGSELCRQIIRCKPKQIILFEISEPALYAIDNELRAINFETNNDDLRIVPLLGSICDQNRLADVLTSYSVQTIYHAAAYKHVPMVEHNVLEGVRNNAIGTLRLAVAAGNAGVESFVLISTDKAVRPTNVMGASKRLAEMILQSLQVESYVTKFSMVRFGNVLDSSGSVVPLFREQIRSGGPVTVTHPEITRYFMTIPEAAELVIQAGSEAQGGDVFVLDMGEPIKIVDLARRMIMLLGLTLKGAENPDGEVEIVFTGLRPGEKLYEELLTGGEVYGTNHPRILRAKEGFIPLPELKLKLSKLTEALDDSDCESVRAMLLSMVDLYSPQNEIDDLVWNRRLLNSTNAAVQLDNVTELSKHRFGQNDSMAEKDKSSD